MSTKDPSSVSNRVGTVPSALGRVVAYVTSHFPGVKHYAFYGELNHVTPIGATNRHTLTKLDGETVKPNCPTVDTSGRELENAHVESEKSSNATSLKKVSYEHGAKEEEPLEPVKLATEN